MEVCLHKWFVKDGHFVSSCDFNPHIMLADNVVYEVVRVIDGKILFLNDHLKRMTNSVRMAGFNLPLQPMQVKNILKQLVKLNKVDVGNIKIVVPPTQHPSAIQFGAWFMQHEYPTRQMFDKGVGVSLVDLGRTEPNIKKHHDKYKETVVQAIQNENVYELLLTTEGIIMEGSRSNVFFISGQTCYTAPNHLVLEGITRQKVIKLCRQNNISLILEAVSINRLPSFEAAFLTGTSRKVIGISNIDNQFHFDVNNKLLLNIRNLFDELVLDYIRA